MRKSVMPGAAVSGLDASDMPSARDLAPYARRYAKHGLDHYSDYGVGCAMTVRMHTDQHPDFDGSNPDHWYVYCGLNINIPGMEFKLHAEQSCVYQFLTDVAQNGLAGDGGSPFSICSVVVCTDEDDGALVCGHCLQVVRSACDYLDQGTEEGHGVYYTSACKVVGDQYVLNTEHLDEVMPETYVERR